MRFKQKTVRLSQIQSSDHSFRITTRKDIDNLMASIHNVGLLNLPLLIENDSGYAIVCGFRRIEACQRLDWSRVQARIIDSDTSRLECIKYAITDNSFQRSLNLIEQARSIYMLSDFFKDLNDLSKELSSMGLPDSPTIIEKIKKIYHLPSSVQYGILTNTISLAMALELGKLKEDVVEGFAKLFNILNVSLNKQREILTLVKEISFREDITMLKVLENNTLQKILTNEKLDRNQKIRKIRIYLKQRRFPAITAAENEFERHVQKLKLGSGAKLISPANFEGTTYTLKFFFKNVIELKDRKATFDEFIQNPYLEKILTQK